MSFVGDISCQRDVLRSAAKEVFHAAATRPAVEWPGSMELPLLHLRMALEAMPRYIVRRRIHNIPR